jgi:hypothetical protein
MDDEDISNNIWLEESPPNAIKSIYDIDFPHRKYGKTWAFSLFMTALMIAVDPPINLYIISLP